MTNYPKPMDTPIDSSIHINLLALISKMHTVFPLLLQRCVQMAKAACSLLCMVLLDHDEVSVVQGTRVVTGTCGQLAAPCRTQPVYSEAHSIELSFCNDLD